MYGRQARSPSPLPLPPPSPLSSEYKEPNDPTTARVVYLSHQARVNSSCGLAISCVLLWVFPHTGPYTGGAFHHTGGGFPHTGPYTGGAFHHADGGFPHTGLYTGGAFHHAGGGFPHTGPYTGGGLPHTGGPCNPPSCPCPAPGPHAHDRQTDDSRAVERQCHESCTIRW